MTINPSLARPSPRASLDAVLAYAWNAGPFTSGDAVAATGLTRSTTIDALEELISTGLLDELPNARAAGDYRAGRPSRRFAFRADAAVVVGVDADREHLDTTVADLLGDPIARRTVPLDPRSDSADERRAAILEEIEAALREARRSPDQVLAICVGVPAPVDASGRSPGHREGFWPRMNPEVLELLGERFPIVRVENDASLAAVAEGRVGGARGCSDYVALIAGSRLGAGIVLDGRLLRGANGGAGEMLAFDYVAGVGTAAGLEEMLSEWGGDHGAADAAAVLAAAADGAVWATALVERAGEALARIVAVIGGMYDPQRIVVLGSEGVDLSPVMTVAEARIGELMHLPPPMLVLSTLTSPTATGAILTAVAAARDGVLHLPSPERSPLRIDDRP